MFEVTEVMSVNMVIVLLEPCISFFNLVMHPVSEVMAQSSVS